MASTFAQRSSCDLMVTSSYLNALMTPGPHCCTSSTGSLPWSWKVWQGHFCSISQNWSMLSTWTTPMAEVIGGRLNMMSAAVSGAMYLGVSLTKMKPMASAPLLMAAWASSWLVMPQILILVLWCIWDGRDLSRYLYAKGAKGVEVAKKRGLGESFRKRSQRVWRPERSSATYAVVPTTMTFCAKSGVSYEPRSVVAAGSVTSMIWRPKCLSAT